MRGLALAASDALAFWMDDAKDDMREWKQELDHYMGALKRALENYKG
jgi:hypothetical protein